MAICLFALKSSPYMYGNLKKAHVHPGMPIQKEENIRMEKDTGLHQVCCQQLHNCIDAFCRPKWFDTTLCQTVSETQIADLVSIRLVRELGCIRIYNDEWLLRVYGWHTEKQYKVLCWEHLLNICTKIVASKTDNMSNSAKHRTASFWLQKDHRALIMVSCSTNITVDCVKICRKHLQSLCPENEHVIGFWSNLIFQTAQISIFSRAVKVTC